MLSRIRSAISRQLARPDGLGGKLIAALMNRGNSAMNDAAIEALGDVRGRQVLDLGFGGGRSIEKLTGAGASVIGVDPAVDMVRDAEDRFAERIADGSVAIHAGTVERLPLADDSVDRVLTVNTVYFWPDLSAGLAEIRRVLRPDGVAVIAIRDGSVMKQVDRSIFTVRTPAEIVAAMDSADLRASVQSPEGQAVHLIIGAGREPGS